MFAFKLKLILVATMLNAPVACQETSQSASSSSTASTKSTETHAALAARFLETADRETYLKVRAIVMKHPSYAPYSDDVFTLKVQHEKGQYRTVLKTVRETPNLWLSPRARAFAYEAAMKLGDTKRAAREKLIMRRCLEGILSTGDGTQEHPYVITRLSDEYDLLAYRKKRSTSQRLLGIGPNYYDVLGCQDSVECWFDVTAIFLWGLIHKRK